MRTWTAPDETVISIAEQTFGSSLKAARLVETQQALLSEADLGDSRYLVAQLAACLESATGPRGPLPVDLVGRLRWLLRLPPSWGPRLTAQLGEDQLDPEEERSISDTPVSASSPVPSSVETPAVPTSAAPVAARPLRRGRGR